MDNTQKVIYRSHRGKRKQQQHHPVLFFFAGMGIGVVILLVVYAFMPHNQTPKQLPEISKNEMKKIPPDVKKALASQALTASSSAEKTASLSATIRVPILMYHYVEYVQDKKDKMRQELDIPPNVFSSQIETMKNAGYTFMTAAQLGQVLDGKMQLPQKPVLITFDDGHWDLDTDVLPILKQYQVKATAYIITGFIGGSDFLSSQQLQDVINSGLVEIGAHTVHHISMKGQTLKTLQYEVDTSKQTLEQQYHLHVVSFAYPYGTFDLQSINVVKADGFSTAVSTIPGVMQNQDNRFFLYRIRPGYRTGQVLLNYLQQSTYGAY